MSQFMKLIQVNGTFKEATIPVFNFYEKHISISFMWFYELTFFLFLKACNFI